MSHRIHANYCAFNRRAIACTFMHHLDVLSNIMFCRGIALAVDGLMEVFAAAIGEPAILSLHAIMATPVISDIVKALLPKGDTLELALNWQGAV